MSKKNQNQTPFQKNPGSIVISPDGKSLQEPRTIAPQGPVLTQMTAEVWKSPLPRPEDLAKFDEVVPGAADRILSQFEKQSDHRRGLEKIAIVGETSRANWGIVCGFIICMTAIIGSFYVALNGAEWAGSIIGSGGLAALAGVFIYGTNAKRKDLQSNT